MVVVHLAKPRRVLLFGSRARGDAHPLSDFDLYVEGSQNRVGLKTAIVDTASAYLTLCAVDIVPDFEASAALKSEVEREGRILYEQEA